MDTDGTVRIDNVHGGSKLDLFTQASHVQPTVQIKRKLANERTPPQQKRQQIRKSTGNTTLLTEREQSEGPIKHDFPSAKLSDDKIQSNENTSGVRESISETETVSMQHSVSSETSENSESTDTSLFPPEATQPKDSWEEYSVESSSDNMEDDDSTDDMDEEDPLAANGHSDVDILANGTSTMGSTDNTQHRNRTENHPSTRGSGRVDLQTDSDAEWEAIAEESKRINNTEIKKTESSLSTVILQPSKKVVSFGPTTTKIITEMPDTTLKENTANIIRNRGIHMVDVRETVSTPVRIEFNMKQGQQEFNVIKESYDLFTLMSSTDTSFKVIDSETSSLVWEPDGQLPEQSDFTRVFRMREQSFRKGTKKVTLYCIITSKHTINRMKFRDPLQSYLLNKNIWIKPDYYSTQVVSSPGYVTLIHPKLTDKTSYVTELQAYLSTVKVDPNEGIVQKWLKRTNTRSFDTETPVPKFHVESTTKKWGQVQTEVLSIHCSEEDSKYLKYLLVEGNSETKSMPKGVYVPSGLPLIASREVATDRKILIYSTLL